jgi:hypothetical protein
MEHQQKKVPKLISDFWNNDEVLEKWQEDDQKWAYEFSCVE